MITMQAWLFLDSYRRLRSTVLDKKSIANLIQLGTKAFDTIGGEKVATAAFSLINASVTNGFLGSFLKLT